MVVNFRARGISRGARKLTQTSTLNSTKKIFNAHVKGIAFENLEPNHEKPGKTWLG
jgi:hypothetical protein